MVLIAQGGGDLLDLVPGSGLAGAAAIFRLDHIPRPDQAIDIAIGAALDPGLRLRAIERRLETVHRAATALGKRVVLRLEEPVPAAPSPKRAAK